MRTTSAVEATSSPTLQERYNACVLERHSVLAWVTSSAYPGNGDLQSRAALQLSQETVAEQSLRTSVERLSNSCVVSREEIDALLDFTFSESGAVIS